MLKSIFIISLLLFSATSCSSQSSERRVGILQFGDSAVTEFAAPDSVQRGEKFMVTFNIYVGGCTEAENIESDLRQRTVEITPYAVHDTTPEKTCPSVVDVVERSVEVSLQEPGEYTIQIIGRKVDSLAEATENIIVLEKSLMISE